VAASNKSKDKAGWFKNSYSAQKERLSEYSSISGKKVQALADSSDLEGFSPEENLGYPGEYPFTRGVQASMYRGRLWTMRQFAGFGSPEDTNKRFHYLLEQGINGLSTAFDMPTLMGYDADHSMSEGEVGREGVSISSIDDMDRLFAGIDLGKVSTSMTINCSAAPVLAMYFALARRRGVEFSKIDGTIQNDILKEFIAQKEWISPPEPSVRVTCDIIEYCSREVPRFNPVSISGYHIREAGSTAAQELAFTLYDGLAYVEHLQARGIDVDTFAPRLSFFFDVHNDFFEEIAKFRAARRLWANLMKNRCGARDPKSWRLRTHAQTAGVSLTAQQPVNNVARVAIQAMAAVLGGTQSLHTNSMDETLSLPTEEAVTVALRTQQIIAEETGVANAIDPLAGSYFVEDLTNQIEADALEYIEKLDSYGGMIEAIDKGYPQMEIAEASSRFQRELENGIRKVVGVNCYGGEESVEIPTLKIDASIEADQQKRLAKFKSERSSKDVKEGLERLKKCCADQENVMDVLVDIVDKGVTVGEVSDCFREVFGVYSDPGFI